MIIRRGKHKKDSDLQICRDLDLTCIPLPKHWIRVNRGKKHTWVSFYYIYTQRIHRMFSEVAPKTNRRALPAK